MAKGIPVWIWLRLGSLIPELPSGVWGMRDAKDCMNLNYASPASPSVSTWSTCLSLASSFFFFCSFFFFSSGCCACREQDTEGMTREDLLRSFQDTDLWDEASVSEVCVYLRGSKGLAMPRDMKDVLGL